MLFFTVVFILLPRLTSPQFGFNPQSIVREASLSRRHIPVCGEGHGNPLQYSCLENPLERGAWRAIVHGVSQSRTRLKKLSMHTCPIWIFNHFFIHTNSSFGRLLNAITVQDSAVVIMAKRWSNLREPTV